MNYLTLLPSVKLQIRRNIKHRLSQAYWVPDIAMCEDLLMRFGYLILSHQHTQTLKALCKVLQDSPSPIGN